MKKILFLLSMVVIFSMSACTKSVPEPEGGNTIVDNQVNEVETTEKVTVKPTEKETEKVTEKATEKATEVATEEVTEKETEAVTEKPTEKVTEATTQKPTEKETEKPTQAKPQETKPVHSHSFSKATCTEAAKCSCGTTSGNALGHAWAEATCTSAQSCTRCGATGNAALGHKWTEATCTKASTCSICGTTIGSALEHNYSEANCDTPATCSICGKISGEALGHIYVNNICTVCEIMNPEYLKICYPETQIPKVENVLKSAPCTKVVTGASNVGFNLFYYYEINMSYNRFVEYYNFLVANGAVLVSEFDALGVMYEYTYDLYDSHVCLSWLGSEYTMLVKFYDLEELPF
ncbi:MAG: hypothetical protein II244_00795 [Clostridia bacterium]|nr:hypothetical protein [Clostridia bacterium]